MIKKILIVSQYFYPENFRINDIAFSLKKRGYDVDVITGLPNYPQGRIFKGYRRFKKRQENIQGVNVKRLPIIARRSNPFSLILNYISFVISGWIWAQRSKKTYDFVFAFEVSPMTQILPAIWYAKKHQVPVVAYIQDIWPESLFMAGKTPNQWIQKRIKNMAHYIYQNLNQVLVPSQKMIPWVKEVNKEAQVNYWPQYFETFYEPKPKKEYSKPTPFRLIFTGNIGFSQGLDSLIELVRNLKDKKSPNEFRCQLIGDGRAKRDLLDKIRIHEIEEYFEFIDPVAPELIPEYLGRADIAYLSFAENQFFEAIIPAKLQSYMACGIPTLVYASGESARIIKEAKAGFTTKNQSINDLVETVESILNMEPIKRDAMRVNARNYAVEHFGKEKLLDWFETNILKGSLDV